jgi:uncharacterized SAM-binding protein YcdF (DUF218 family)
MVAILVNKDLSNIADKKTFTALAIFIFPSLMSALLDFRHQIELIIGNYLIITDSLSPVDVIHVIAGIDYRTEYAIHLYEEGYARQLFFTGGWCAYHNYYHGEHALQLALAAGIPGEAIFYNDSPVLSTYDEALVLKKHLDADPAIKTIMVVSDPLHMRRSQWTFKHIFNHEYKIIMAPVPFDQTPFKQQWWTDVSSQKFVRDEYKKLVYYFFRYQLNIKQLSVLDKK